MFIKNKISPPGCNPLNNEDRMPVMKVVSGDTWVVSAAFTAEDFGPASPKNSVVEFVLSENQFSPPIWTGGWFDGIIPDMFRPGLAHINIPRKITKTLRRGSYMFSARVGDRSRYSFSTQLVGHFLVEYMPTSEQHSIPYRDGTSRFFGQMSSEDVSTACDGIIRVLDESTGLYYKVSAIQDDEGEVSLGIYQEGETEEEVEPLGVTRYLYVLDKKSGLYHRLVAYKSDDGEICLGVYQEGATPDAIPQDQVGLQVRVRNDDNGLLHNIEACTDEEGETNLGVQQSGSFR